MEDWHLLPIDELTDDDRQVYAKHRTDFTNTGEPAGKVVMLSVEDYEQLRSALAACRERERLLKNVAATGRDLIATLQTALEAQYDPEHPIRISRREMMDLPPETRRRVMERCVDKFIAQNVGHPDATSDTLNEDSCVQDVDATTAGRTQAQAGGEGE